MRKPPKKFPLRIGHAEVEVDAANESAGYVDLSPEVHLTGEQAEFLSRLHESLASQGAALPTVGAVVGWMIDNLRGQLAAQARASAAAQVPANRPE